jgi:hypothetical protein
MNVESYWRRTAIGRKAKANLQPIPERAGSD